MIYILLLLFLIALVGKRFSSFDNYYYYNKNPLMVYIVTDSLLVKQKDNTWEPGFIYHKLYNNERGDTSFIRTVDNFSINFTKTNINHVYKNSNLNFFLLTWRIISHI